jgi:hypothetical protein
MDGPKIMPKWIRAARLIAAMSQGSVTSCTSAPASASRAAAARVFATTSPSTS